MNSVLQTGAIIPLVGIVAYLVLLVIVALRRAREEVHVYFIVYLASMLIWSIGSFLMRVDIGYGSTLFWNRFMAVGSTGMPIAFFAFVRSFIRRKSRIVLTIGVGLYVFTLIADLAGWLIVDAKFEGGILTNVYGPALPLIGVGWVTFIGYSAVELMIQIRKTRDTNFRNRIRYLLVVIMVMLAGSLTNGTVLKYYPVDIGFNAVCAIIIAYAILRYQLLDIKLVFRKGLLYSIPTIIIGASYFLIIYFVTAVFQAIAGPQLFIIAIVVAVIAAIAVQPLRDGAQMLIDKLFFREQFDVRLMLQRLSNSTASILDLDLLTGMILDEVSNTMHVTRLALFLRNEEEQRYEMVAHRGLEGSQSTSLAFGHTLVEWLASRAAPLTKTRMEVLPQFKALWINEREELELLGMDLFIPLRAKGVTVGILAAGPKRSGLTYSQDDLLTLETLSNQTAVTVENARLYGELQRTLRALKTAHDELELRVQERTAELAEANEALQVEITERRNAEEIIRASLDEKDVLLAEIHHRVKNNLQIVSSLLNLQAQVTDDESSREALKNSQSRIRSMALVHEKLYRSEDLSKIEFSGYVSSLASDLLQTFTSNGSGITIDVDIEEIPLGANTVVPCGLILNELISNALKYAFVGKAHGTIRIALRLDGPMWRLEVSDDGVGIGQNENNNDRSSLGMQLVEALVTQIDGTMDLRSESGTQYTITFPRTE